MRRLLYSCLLSVMQCENPRRLNSPPSRSSKWTRQDCGATACAQSRIACRNQLEQRNSDFPRNPRRPRDDGASAPDSIDVKSCGSNLLHVAASEGHAKIVAELLARRPSLADEVNSHGRTPLFCAVCHGHQEAVDLLPLTTKQVLLALFPLSFLFPLLSFFFSLAMVSAGSASRLRRQHSAACGDHSKACSGSTGVGNEP